MNDDTIARRNAVRLEVEVLSIHFIIQLDNQPPNPPLTHTILFYFKNHLHANVENYGDCSVQLFGSSLSGFGTASSDIDLVITFPHWGRERFVPHPEGPQQGPGKRENDGGDALDLVDLEEEDSLADAVAATETAEATEQGDGASDNDSTNSVDGAVVGGVGGGVGGVVGGGVTGSESMDGFARASSGPLNDDVLESATITSQGNSSPRQTRRAKTRKPKNPEAYSPTASRVRDPTRGGVQAVSTPPPGAGDLSDDEPASRTLEAMRRMNLE